MAKTTRQSSNANGVTFSDREAETLRMIVRDWIRTELVAPPHSPEVRAVLDKLGAGMDEGEAEREMAADVPGAAVETTARDVEDLDPTRTPPLRPNLG